MGAYHAKGSSLCAVAGVSQVDIKPGSEVLHRSLVLYVCLHTYLHTTCQSIIVLIFVSYMTGIMTCC